MDPRFHEDDIGNPDLVEITISSVKSIKIIIKFGKKVNLTLDCFLFLCYNKFHSTGTTAVVKIS